MVRVVLATVAMAVMAMVPVAMVMVVLPMVVQVTATTVVVIPAILLMICLVVLEASAVLTVSRDNPASITVRMLLITLLHLTILITDTFRKL